MDQAMVTPGPTAERDATTVGPVVRTNVVDAAEAVDATPAVEKGRRWRLPDWWHRDHPVFVPLAGFFAGMAYIIVIPGLYGAILKAMVGYERAEDLFPFVLLTLVVPIGLLVPQHTRKFGRYMLFGAVATLLVVVGVAALVLWILLQTDG